MTRARVRRAASSSSTTSLRMAPVASDRRSRSMFDLFFELGAELAFGVEQSCANRRFRYARDRGGFAGRPLFDLAEHESHALLDGQPIERARKRPQELAPPRLVL